jgi:hypothetical protein
MGRLLRISPWTLEKLTERTEKLPESGKFCRVKATFSALRRRPKRVKTLPLKISRQRVRDSNLVLPANHVQGYPQSSVDRLQHLILDNRGNLWTFCYKNLLSSPPKMASLARYPNSPYWIACFRDENRKQHRRSTHETNRRRAKNSFHQLLKRTSTLGLSGSAAGYPCLGRSYFEQASYQAIQRTG